MKPYVSVIRHWTGSALVQEMDYCLINAKPLPEPIQTDINLSIVSFSTLEKKLQWNCFTNTCLHISQIYPLYELDYQPYYLMFTPDSSARVTQAGWKCFLFCQGEIYVKVARSQIPCNSKVWGYDKMCRTSGSDGFCWIYTRRIWKPKPRYLVAFP